MAEFPNVFTGPQVIDLVSTDTAPALQFSNAGTGKDIALSVYGTVTAAAGAATLQAQKGLVTSESLTTAAGSTYTLTLTNAKVATTSQVRATATLGTSTTGTPYVTKITPGAGSVTIVVTNIHASAALNGNILIDYFIY